MAGWPEQDYTGAKGAVPAHWISHLETFQKTFSIRIKENYIGGDHHNKILAIQPERALQHQDLGIHKLPKGKGLTTLHSAVFSRPEVLGTSNSQHLLSVCWTDGWMHV